MGDKSCESVDMHSEFDLYKVPFFDVGGIFLQGAKVATDLIDGDGGGEGESLENWFFIIDFGEFFIDEAIGPEAEFEDFGVDGYLLDEFGENL